MKKSGVIGAFVAIVAVTLLAVVGNWKEVRMEEAGEKQGWTLTSYADDSGNQGMFYTLYNNDDRTLIVIDGGWAENEQQVRNVIKGHGGTVSAWFVTHYHNDHVDAFNRVYANPDGIKIEKIYDSPIDYDKYIEVAQEWDTVDSFTTYLEQTNGDERVTHLNRGDVLDIDGLQVEVFNSYDEITLATETTDIPNDAALMLKISSTQDSILFCSDCHSQVMADMLMKEYTAEQLHAEYVQPGHHGNNSLPVGFYDYIKPKQIIFDAPEWLMTGVDYTAKDLAAYMESMGVECYDYRTAPNSFVFQ